MLKFQFALEQWVDESQEMILNELKSGPYELIQGPDVKEIWKSRCSPSLRGFFRINELWDTVTRYCECQRSFAKEVLTLSKAAKESSVKCWRLINAMNYYFNIQFKKYKAEHHRAEHEDSWTRCIISKVYCA
jgi:hypothetical protein